MNSDLAHALANGFVVVAAADVAPAAPCAAHDVCWLDGCDCDCGSTVTAAAAVEAVAAAAVSAAGSTDGGTVCAADAGGLLAVSAAAVLAASATVPRAAAAAVVAVPSPPLALAAVRPHSCPDGSDSSAGPLVYWHC